MNQPTPQPTLIPLAQTQRLLRDIPDAQLHIIEDGSHFLPIDTPGEVGRVVGKFLEDEYKISNQNGDPLL